MQIIQNLPTELLRQPRFFQLTGNAKSDTPPNWNKPPYQKFFRDIRRDCLAGFDTCGHGKAADYLFLDFDHVLDDNGNFVNDKAEQCFNAISTIVLTFTEKSISGHGLHKLYKPTPNKFKPISAGKQGTLYFDDKRTKDSPKLEIFYASKGRYCLFTGDVFQCEPNTPIASGELADQVLQFLIDQIFHSKDIYASPNYFEPKFRSEKIKAQTAQIHSDTQDYDIFRAGIMLDCIVPADLPDTDWLAVQSAAKNIGIPYNVVDAFNQQDPQRYNEAENLKRWDSLDNPSFDISTLHGIAKRFGYQEKDAMRQWYKLHPNLKPSNSRAKNIAPDLQRELDDAIIFLDSLLPDDFTADDAYNHDNIRAVAIANFFGFAAQTEKFFNVISQAKSEARNCIKDAETGLIYPFNDDEKNSLNATININVKSIRQAINLEHKEIANSQKSFTQNQQRKQAQEKAQARAEKHQQQFEIANTSLTSLQEQYRKHPTKKIADQMRDIIADACEWRCDRNGFPISVKANAANANLIFSYDPVLDGLFGYDEFKQADVFLKRPPWKKDKYCIGDEWRDSDDNETCLYLRNHYKDFAAKDLFFQCVTHYSNLHSFHEVKNFFNRLPKWDGKKRAANLFIKFLRVEDTPYARAVTMNWLVAAVARIFHPACPYQTALVLHGAQGIGKSFILEKLGGKWYSAIIDNVDDPHAIDALKNTWIGEFKEMAGMRKAELNAIKSFIERSEDNRRAAYERRAAKIKRHCVFAITVNDDHFLTDTTGNRRYLILHCNSKPLDYVEGLTDEYIQQVWAEVLQYCKELFQDGFDTKKLELSREFRIQAEEIAQQYLRDDGLSGEIKAFLDTKILPPVIWNLLSREERRKFFVDGGCLTMVDALSEFNHRRRARGGNPDKVQHDVNLICDFLEGVAGKNFVRSDRITRNGNSVEEFHIYGSELRQHICAAEIFTECFGSDKRKSMQRIHEILPTLDGWELGKRIRNCTAYGDQKKAYYRIQA